MARRTDLPAPYAWLASEGAPRMIVEALKLYGTKETPGPGDNDVILDWARETGLAHIYNHDAVPWCGLFAAVVAQRAGKAIPNGPLWALNWGHFGHDVPAAMLGDVLVFKRPGGGHVGLYVGEDAEAYHVLAGNQGDAVSISRIAKSRCVAIRRPDYHVKPANVRVIHLAADGALSTNEA